MQVANGAPLRGLARAYFEHVRTVVLRLRMVRLMHLDGVCIVVDGDIDVPAERHFDGGGHAATAREQVNDELALDAEQQLVADHCAPPLPAAASMAA